MEATKKNFYLCCDDNAEHVVFSSYKFSDGDIAFEISIADSYLQKREYTGFWGRCKEHGRLSSGSQLYTPVSTQKIPQRFVDF